ncbi:MAG: restriction endonuclease subunit S [Blastocatellia bacterium]
MKNSTNLPNGWTLTKLKDLSERRGGGTPSRLISKYFQGNIPWITVADLPEIGAAPPQIKTSREFITEEAIVNSSAKYIPLGSIVFATRVSIGKTAIAGCTIATNQDFRALLPGIAHTTEYIAWFLTLVAKFRLPTYRGTTIKGITTEDFDNIEVPLPPLPEQRRIVAKIDALFERSRRARQFLEAIPPLLEKFRQSVLAAAFRGDLTKEWREKNKHVEPASVLLERIRAERRQRWEETELAKMRAKGREPLSDDWKAKYVEPEPVDTSDLPELPEGWEWVRAEEICDFITKGTTPAANKMFEKCGDIPFIKVYNLTDKGSLDFSINPTFVSKSVHDGELARSKVYPGDILMNIVGPPLGKVSIVPTTYEEWNINQAIVFFRPLLGINNIFISYCLLSKPILDVAINAAKATAGQFNLTLEICRNLPLPIPPTLKQEEIVRLLDKSFLLADSIQNKVNKCTEQSLSLDRSILAKAFRGELVPQDPNDEPASVLLERIKAEHTASEEATKGKKAKSKQAAKQEAQPQQSNIISAEQPSTANAATKKDDEGGRDMVQMSLFE